MCLLRWHHAGTVREDLPQPTWDEDVRSGPGSDPAYTGEYVGVVESVLKRLAPATVVDLGCGDGNVARQVRWGDVHYTGVEVVPHVVDELRERFGSEKMQFVCADLVSDSLPDADLAICKDVMQHWSNGSVKAFLPRLLKYRFALVTNDVRKTASAGVGRVLRKRRGRPPNSDIEDGQSRPLRLRDAPFSVEAELISTLKMVIGPTIFEKEVLLLRGQPSTASHA